MAGKSKVFDYEPLRNPRRSTVAHDAGFSPDATGVSSTDLESSFDSGVRTSGVATPSAQTEPSQILKRGHALTFAGVFLFTFLLFFRPYEFSTSLSWLSKGALITAILTLVFFIPTQLGLENRITVRTREINLVLLIALLAMISIPFALDRFRAWNGFLEYMKIVVMFVVTVNVVRSEKQLKALLLLVLVATCILSLSAINDYRLGNLVLMGVRIQGAIGGMFENPNDLALHFVTFFPIVIVLALSSRYMIAKLIYFAAAAAALGGVIVTFSRGGFLGMIFVIAALVWKLSRKNFFIVGVVSALLVFFLLILAPGAYRDRISTTGDGSSVARMGELKRSIFLSVRNPFFGVGMDNYILFSDREQGTHNSYTQVSAEIGFPGMVVYVLFLIATLKRVATIPDPKSIDEKKRRLPYLAIGVQAGLIGYMVSSFFAAVAFLWYVYYLAAYAICISRLHQSALAQTNAVNVSNNGPSAYLAEPKLSP